MRKQAPVVEWTIAENDADWERRLLPLPALPLVADKGRRRQYLLWRGAALLLLLVAVGDGWRRSQGKAHRTTAEVTALAQTTAPDREALIATISTEQAKATWWLQAGEEDFGVSALRPTVDPTAPLGVVLPTVEIVGDQAVVRLVTPAPNGASAYRQTHFYQHTAAGWVRTDPSAALWGAEQQWETPYFVFHFRQHDAAAVMAIAPRLDALYTTLHRNFGLLLTPGVKKLSIEVSITQAPENAMPWFGVANPLLVPSPARYLAPVALTDATLLEQALALPLLSAVLGRASEQYALRSDWQPLLSGLRLWQVWDMNLPLAAWRGDIVQWLYADLTVATPGGPVMLPDRYAELCTAHKLWLSSPAQMNIPLLCTELEQEHWYYFAWGLHPPPTHLEYLPLSMPQSYPYEEVRLHRGQTVALTTLIEYALATYGRGRLPALLASLDRYESWVTLIPAVYGVSAAEFEAGWQAYLAGQYGVPRSRK